MQGQWFPDLRLEDKSRMTEACHVPCRKDVGVKFPLEICNGFREDFEKDGDYHRSKDDQ